MDRLNNLPPDQLGLIFEKLRPELIGVELEDAQEVLDSMFDKTGEEVLEEEDFLRKLENPCSPSSNLSSSPSPRFFRSPSRDLVRSPPAQPSPSVIRLPYPRILPSSSSEFLLAPQQEFARTPPPLSPYLISPESAFSSTPETYRSTEQSSPAPPTYNDLFGEAEEYIKYRASIITTREKDQAAENNFIAQLVNPSSPSRPETPLQGIDARPETPNAVVVRELDTTDEESDSDSYDYTEDEIAVLTYIDQYKPLEAELVPELHPFVIEYMAAFGEVDSFIKVPRPDEIDDNIGLMFLDEPPSNQSDAAIVDMQIRHATKDAAYLDDEVPVKILEKADEKPDEIKKWIADIKTLHKSQPATTVHYKTKLPDIETLMQEWSPRLEEIMRTVRLPTAELDVSLEKYVDICLNILDIPVGKSRIEALHVMFSLLNEFSNSQHFRNLAQNNNRLEDSRERMDRLEL